MISFAPGHGLEDCLVAFSVQVKLLMVSEVGIDDDIQAVLILEPLDFLLLLPSLPYLVEVVLNLFIGYIISSCSRYYVGTELLKVLILHQSLHVQLHHLTHRVGRADSSPLLGLSIWIVLIEISIYSGLDSLRMSQLTLLLLRLRLHELVVVVLRFPAIPRKHRQHCLLPQLGLVERLHFFGGQIRSLWLLPVIQITRF